MCVLHTEIIVCVLHTAVITHKENPSESRTRMDSETRDCQSSKQNQRNKHKLYLLNKQHDRNSQEDLMPEGEEPELEPEPEELQAS